MARKEWLIDSHILNGHNPLLALQLHHPINQQKRVAMRQNRLDLVDVHCAGGGCGGRSSVAFKFVVSLILKREL